MRDPDELVKALEECRKTLLEAGACIQNEIACCELSGRSSNAWPDIMTGCVSGGGIENAITVADAALASYREAKGEEYRMLEEGETIKSGDQYFIGWRDVFITIGDQVIRDAVGTVRRPIRKEQP